MKKSIQVKVSDPVFETPSQRLAHFSSSLEEQREAGVKPVQEVTWFWSTTMDRKCFRPNFGLKKITKKVCVSPNLWEQSLVLQCHYTINQPVILYVFELVQN